MNPPRCTTKRRINALSIAKLHVAMMDEAHSAYELAAIVGLSMQTTRHYVLALHKEGGCYVSHWVKDSQGRYMIPAYSLGHGKDVKKPSVTKAESNRRWVEKRKQRNIMFALAAVPLAA